MICPYCKHEDSTCKHEISTPEDIARAFEKEKEVWWPQDITVWTMTDTQNSGRNTTWTGTKYVEYIIG